MVKVLFDHNMPPAIARALHEIISKDGHESYALRDLFKVSVEDVEYLDKLGGTGNWIIVSKDLQNAKKKAERAAILRNGVVAFYLSPTLQKKHIAMQAAAILWHWPSMEKQRELVERGLFQLPENRGRFRPL